MAARKREGDQVAPARPLRVGLTSLPVAFACALAALGVASWQLVERAEWSDRAAEEEAVLEAAEEGVVTWATVDFREADRYFEAVEERGTGAFLEEFREARDKNLGEVLEQMKSIQIPEVPEGGVGLVELSEKSATVLVALDATVSNVSTKGPEPREYRMQVGMTKVGSKWLISELEFVS